MTFHAFDAAGTGHGTMVLHINRPNIHPQSKVFASICELTRDDAHRPFIGSARMTIHNVAPQEGSVDIWAQIDWDHDLLFTINLLVVNL